MIDELDDAQIDDVLTTATVARLGCRDDEGVYVVPISYAYGDGCVYGHCAGGKKLDLMRARPEVCVEVEDVRGLTDWRSVIAQGRFEELSGDQADEAMQLLMRRFRRERPSRTALPDDGHGTTDHGHGAGTGAPVLYRIRLHSRTGRGETPR